MDSSTMLLPSECDMLLLLLLLSSADTEAIPRIQRVTREAEKRRMFQ
jgi:hypothetical protein